MIVNKTFLQRNQIGMTDPLAYIIQKHSNTDIFFLIKEHVEISKSKKKLKKDHSGMVP